MTVVYIDTINEIDEEVIRANVRFEGRLYLGLLVLERDDDCTDPLSEHIACVLEPLGQLCWGCDDVAVDYGSRVGSAWTRWKWKRLSCTGIGWCKSRYWEFWE
jgi:hypothetical protein